MKLEMGIYIPVVLIDMTNLTKTYRSIDSQNVTITTYGNLIKFEVNFCRYCNPNGYVLVLQLSIF